MKSTSPCAITWLGHATVLLELDGTRVVTDPVLRDRVGPLVRIAEPTAEPALTMVDYVLLSHLHADHTDLPSLQRLVVGHSILAPDGAAAWMHRRGFPDVREMKVGETAEADGLRITATRAVHDERRRPFGARASPVGYLVRGSVTAYFAGDTDLFPEMAELHGLVDIALLPVSGWGPRVPHGHLDPERAAQAAATIAPRIAIPIHWGTLAPMWSARRATNPWRPAREFAALSREYAPGVEVRLLAPGDRTEL